MPLSLKILRLCIMQIFTARCFVSSAVGSADDCSCNVERLAAYQVFVVCTRNIRNASVAGRATDLGKRSKCASTTLAPGYLPSNRPHLGTHLQHFLKSREQGALELGHHAGVCLAAEPYQRRHRLK